MATQNLKNSTVFVSQLETLLWHNDCSLFTSSAVPPTLSLTSDKNGVAVCQATAGKPAAKISWIPASNHSVEKDVHHLNGTVTRVSYISWVNNTHPNVTCLVTHPAVNQTLSLDLSGKEHHSVIVLHHILVTVIFFAAVSTECQDLADCLVVKRQNSCAC